MSNAPVNPGRFSYTQRRVRPKRLQMRLAVRFPSEQRPRDGDVVGSDLQQLHKDPLPGSCLGKCHNRRRMSIASCRIGAALHRNMRAMGARLRRRLQVDMDESTSGEGAAVDRLFGWDHEAWIPKADDDAVVLRR